MSLIKCNECDNMVSSSAKACPQCGAKIPKTKLWLWIPLGFVLILLAIGILAPEDKYYKEATNFTSYVKDMMKDPKSFDVVELRVSNLGAICLTYRAKNSFNAYLQGYAVKTPDGKIQIDGVKGTEKYLWAGNCSIGGGKTYHY
jgi:hypothetical protein